MGPEQCDGGATHTSGIEAAGTCSFEDSVIGNTDRLQHDMNNYLQVSA